MAEGRRWREGAIEVVGFNGWTNSGVKESAENYRGATFIRAQAQATGMNTQGSSLRVFIEDMLDGGANWHPVEEFPELVSDEVRMEEVRIVNVTRPFTDTLRVRWEIAPPRNAPSEAAPPEFSFGVRWYVE